ncbi:trehalose-phosphatase [Ruania albidiflava]|uniref:trehalose-phosphatase n=1 Tax=Ruania albidiflava TaxID=366586 RepID=UPI0003B633A1|nr:trehalose-phosphatase [Ruania albidiflava]
MSEPTSSRPSGTEPGGPELTAALQDFIAAPAVLVALDFDGCLAPFVLDPADARPLPASAAALHDLGAQPGVHLALVSGRPLADLFRLADPPPGTVLVGSHGAERGEVDAAGELHLTPVELTEDQQNLLAHVTSAVEQIAHAHPGVWIEHKPAAAVVHTRALPDEQAEAVLREAMTGPGTLAGVSAMHGDQVVELAVVDATKGESLQALRTTRPGVPALYAGDDVTDETALAVLGPGDVGVKVGAARTVAEHRVAGVEEVAQMLQRLAMWRATRSSR